MKYLIILSFLVTSCMSTKVNLRSDKFSYRELVDDKWTTFSDWYDCDIKVEIKSASLNIIRPKMVIYDKEKITLKILEQNPEDTTEQGYKVISYNCKDNDGDKCYLILVDKGESVNAVIYYQNVNLCYNMIQTK